MCYPPPPLVNVFTNGSVPQSVATAAAVTPGHLLLRVTIRNNGWITATINKIWTSIQHADCIHDRWNNVCQQGAIWAAAEGTRPLSCQTADKVISVKTSRRLWPQCSASSSVMSYCHICLYPYTCPLVCILKWTWRLKWNNEYLFGRSAIPLAYSHWRSIWTQVLTDCLLAKHVSACLFCACYFHMNAAQCSCSGAGDEVIFFG